MQSLEKRIRQFNADRLPDMVQLKYKAMAENMFRFYRGTCHLFYEDLSREKAFPDSPPAWICGDLHLENFGSYKGDNRQVYFDLNDFDEAVLAPALWEVARLVTSILVAFEILEIDRRQAQNMAKQFLRNYAHVLVQGKAMYIERNIARGIVCNFLESAENHKKKKLLHKKTVNNELIKIDNRKHFRLDRSLKRELIHHMEDWIMNNHDSPYNFRVLDVAFRVAGTGSVGQRRYIFLLESLKDEKHMLVDMKQAMPSSLSPYLQYKQPHWASEAERVVGIQKRMENVAPAFLSHTCYDGQSYVIQELQPVKDSIDFKLIRDRYRDMYQVIDDMALLTASAQLRSSGREGSANADKLIAFGGRSDWQEAVLAFATRYLKKTMTNFKTYEKLYEAGKFAL